MSQQILHGLLQILTFRYFLYLGLIVVIMVKNKSNVVDIISTRETSAEHEHVKIIFMSVVDC